ncbi:hypothetical protein E2542_SST28971 [Spatholobus suberectus]|nr:hypothetical protein E2542_SST28971 [Spatholobus suberectus]
MNTILLQILALVAFLVLVLIPIEGKSTTPNTLHQNATTSVSSPMSPWVKNVVKGRTLGCRGRSWVCNQGESPPRFL